MKAIVTFLFFTICIVILAQDKGIYDIASDGYTTVLDSTVTYTAQGDKKSKTSYYYNNTDEKEMSVSYIWDSSNRVWKYTNRYVYAYDSYGNKVLEEYYNRWDSSIGKWIGTSKFIYQYDANGSLLLEEEYNSWDSSTEKWGGKSKFIYAYDSNGYEAIRECYLWENGDWKGDYKYINEYDTEGNILLKEYYNIWAEEVWTGATKHIYAYDFNSNNTLLEKYNWEKDANRWLESNKEVREFDAESRLTSEAKYNWNKLVGIWAGITKNISVYNENGNQTKKEVHYWNSGTRDFYLSEYTLFYYGRSQTGIQPDKIKANYKVYKKNGSLVINSEEQEAVEFFNLEGKRLHVLKKNEGEISVSIEGFPEIILVKGGSGWSSKILIK